MQKNSAPEDNLISADKQQFDDLYIMLAHEAYKLNRTTRSIIKFSRTGTEKNNDPVNYRKLKLKIEIDDMLSLLNEKISSVLHLK